MSTQKYLSTNVYKKFKRLTGNRDVNRSHVNALKRSIQQNPEGIKFNPILVNDQMEVIDGQHRLKALEELKLPVYFIKAPNLTILDTQRLNSNSKQWNFMDYAKSFAEFGNENYKTYLDMRSLGVCNSHSILVEYLSLYQPISTKIFKNGALLIPDKDRSVDLLSKLRDVGYYHDDYTKKSFALAFLKFATDQRYDHDRFLSLMSARGLDIVKSYSTEIEYFKAFNKLYNFGRSKETREYFGDIEYLSRDE